MIGAAIVRAVVPRRSAVGRGLLSARVGGGGVEVVAQQYGTLELALQCIVRVAVGARDRGRES